jgi:hypothetical protein
MIPPVESLVKYDKPVLVSSSREKDKAKGKKETFGVDSKGKALQTEDILNAILPPRCDVWAARAHTWGGVLPRRTEPHLCGCAHCQWALTRCACVPKGVDRGRRIVGSVCVSAAGDAIGCNFCGGAPRSAPAAEACPRQRHLHHPRGALCPMFRCVSASPLLWSCGCSTRTSTFSLVGCLSLPLSAARCCCCCCSHFRLVPAPARL